MTRRPGPAPEDATAVAARGGRSRAIRERRAAKRNGVAAAPDSMTWRTVVAAIKRDASIAGLTPSESLYVWQSRLSDPLLADDATFRPHEPRMFAEYLRRLCSLEDESPGAVHAET